MRAADALIAALERHGVDTVFGIPGGAALPLYDALATSSIRHVLTRHEAAAGHAAEGWARATGRPGVAIATSGLAPSTSSRPSPTPSWTRCRWCSSAGRSPRTCAARWRSRRPTWPAWRRRSSSTPRPPGMATTWPPPSPRPTRSQAPAGPPGAARDPGRRGQGAGAATRRRNDRAAAPTDAAPCPEPEHLARALAVLSAAQRPLILAGGGAVASGAQQAIRELAATVDAPYVTTLHGQPCGGGPGWLGMAGVYGTQAANWAVHARTASSRSAHGSTTGSRAAWRASPARRR